MLKGPSAQEGAECVRGQIFKRATGCSTGSGCSSGPYANKERVLKRRTGF